MADASQLSRKLSNQPEKGVRSGRKHPNSRTDCKQRPETQGFGLPEKAELPLCIKKPRAGAGGWGGGATLQHFGAAPKHPSVAGQVWSLNIFYMQVWTHSVFFQKCL